MALTRLLLCGWLAALLAALAPSTAAAHAMLLSTAPAEGAILGAPPERLTLSFNEPVKPLALRLTTPEGAEADLTARAEGGLALRIPFEASGAGSYVLNWRVVSEDGHPIAGALVFSLGTATITGAVAAPEGDPRLRGLIWAARALTLVGLAFGIGGALFRAFAGTPPEAERPLRLLTLLGVGAAVLFLGLHGLDALGLPLSALFSAAPWRAGASTSFGPTVLLAAAAGGLALAARRRAALGWAAAGLLAAAFALSGHAAAAQPQWATRPLVGLHVLALLFWTGALIPLVFWMRRADGAAALRRFSAAIPVVLILLIGAGAGLAAVQLGPDPALWPSPYGAVLGAKLGLLALIFGLAAYNRFALTKPALAGEERAKGRLSRAIALETLLVFGVLAVAAGWRFTPPPRALAALAAAPAPAATAHFGSDQAMADVAITPGAPGRVLVEILPYDGAMIPAEPLAVTLGIAHEGHGLNRRTYPAQRGEDGVWRVEGLILPHRGVWEVDLTLRLDRFTQTRIAGTIAIP